MTIRPIIFSAEMVRALLEGRKTQTRRLATSPLRKCEPGDLLYVRETCSAVETHDGFDSVRYEADQVWRVINDTPEAADRWVQLHHYGNRRGANVPSIHMPRWASRLTLRVTDVRFQRVTEIDGIDALAEGITRVPGRAPWRVFCTLWDSLHDRPGERFFDSPQTVALTFEVIHGNVDEIARAE